MLDHGILNVPLSKRGDIDAQIDKHKAALKALERERAKELIANRKKAKAFLETLDPAVIQRVAERAGITLAKAKKELNSMAYFEPVKLLKNFRQQ